MTTTVEQRIMNEYQRPVADLLQEYANEGLTSKQVALKLSCGISNVRRIARKYNIRFNQPAAPVKMIYSEQFLEKKINSINLLSRPWQLRRAVKEEFETV
jgi:hypothetical protein